jgi:hypothetical protein
MHVKKEEKPLESLDSVTRMLNTTARMIFRILVIDGPLNAPRAIRIYVLRKKSERPDMSKGE